MNLSPSHRKILFVIGLLAVPVGAFAQLTNQTVMPATAPDLNFSVLRLAGALALVVALFFGAVWLFKKWQRIAKQPFGTQSHLSILEMKSLGNRQALYVVGYDRQRMLIATSPNSVTLISTLPEAESAAPVAASSTFVNVLQQVLSRKS